MAPKIETARKWLELVRREGDPMTKRAYLRERGFDDGQIDELLKEDEAARREECGC